MPNASGSLLLLPAPRTYSLQIVVWEIFDEGSWPTLTLDLMSHPHSLASPYLNIDGKAAGQEAPLTDSVSNKLR